MNQIIVYGVIQTLAIVEGVMRTLAIVERSNLDFFLFLFGV